jgi:pre-60S factor REI1
VYNVKRRVASLPPITLHTFNTDVEKSIAVKETRKIVRSKSSDSNYDENVSDKEDEQSASPFQCLFCNQSFGSDDAGFAANLEHMHIVHGMSIPDPELVVDMYSFVGYLATEVRSWHECLYCGASKPSTMSIQSHMRDKRHCQLNFDREPELLDFWESPPQVDEDADDDGAAAVEQERPANLSTTELRFPSGKVIGSRHTASTAPRASKKRALVIKALPSSSEGAESPPPAAEPQFASGRQLARREEMGLVGISVQQRQALALAEKKAQRSEDVARRTREWISSKGANSQKYDQADNQMKWGKQNHKLQPR